MRTLTLKQEWSAKGTRLRTNPRGIERIAELVRTSRIGFETQKALALQVAASKEPQP